MTRPIRTIVAALASPDAEDYVLFAAMQLANRADAALQVVQVVPPPVPPDARKEIRRRLEAYVRAHRRRHGIRCHVAFGDPSRELSRFAEERGADLLVVGSTRRGKLGRRILGTTAGRVLRHAHVPVFVVRQPSEPRSRHVLLAIGLSEGDAHAARLGMGMAEALAPGGPPLFRCLSVVPVETGDPSLNADEQMRAGGAEELERFIGEQAGPNGRMVARLRAGAPVEQIVTEATEWPADLLVVGTRGGSGPSRWEMGSVAERVVRDAPCNVLVVPPPEEA